MNNHPWLIRFVPDAAWKSLFWIVRNCAASARLGWDAAAPIVGGSSVLRPR